MCKRFAWSLTLTISLFTADAVSADGPLSLSAGVLFLDRSTPNACDVIIDDLHEDVVDAADYSFDMEAGFLLGARLQLNTECALFGEYFNVDWDDAIQAGGTGLWVASIDGASGDFAGLELQTTLESELQSALIGIESQVNDWLSIHIAYRYLSLDDELWARFSHGIIEDGVYRDTADNDLHGFDLGLGVLLLDHGRKNVSLRTGFGLYDNEVDHWAYYRGGGGTTAYREGSTTTAWSYNLQLDCSYAVTDNLQLGVGYRLLYLDNVATGTDQTTFTDFANLLGTNDQADVLFQGLNIFAIWTI